MEMAVFQKNTAQGKLNAVMTPTLPFSGFHRSIIKCSARSEGMIEPLNIRDRPTA